MYIYTHTDSWNCTCMFFIPEFCDIYQLFWFMFCHKTTEMRDMWNTVLKWKRIMLSAISGFRPGDSSVNCNKMKLCTDLYTQHLFETISRWDKADRSCQSSFQQNIYCIYASLNTMKVSTDRKLVNMQVKATNTDKILSKKKGESTLWTFILHWRGVNQETIQRLWWLINIFMGNDTKDRSKLVMFYNSTNLKIFLEKEQD